MKIKIKYCQHCDSELKPNANFCSGCGEKVEKFITCTCGVQLSLNDKFCYQCGEKVTQEQSLNLTLDDLELTFESVDEEEHFNELLRIFEEDDEDEDEVDSFPSINMPANEQMPFATINYSNSPYQTFEDILFIFKGNEIVRLVHGMNEATSLKLPQYASKFFVSEAGVFVVYNDEPGAIIEQYSHYFDQLNTYVIPEKTIDAIYVDGYLIYFTTYKTSEMDSDMYDTYLYAFDMEEHSLDRLASITEDDTCYQIAMVGGKVLLKICGTWYIYYAHEGKLSRFSIQNILSIDTSLNEIYYNHGSATHKAKMLNVSPFSDDFDLEDSIAASINPLYQKDDFDFYNRYCLYHDKKVYGFTYGHPSKYKYLKSGYYDLYEVSEEHGYKPLHASGGQGGIERFCLFGDYLVIDTNIGLQIKQIEDGQEFEKLIIQN